MRLSVINAREARATAHWPVHRKTLQTKYVFNLIQQLQRLTSGTIAFVDKSENRNPAMSADLEQFKRLLFNPLGAIQYHHGSVHRHQHAISVLRKIAVTGSIQQIDITATVIKLQYRRGNGNTALTFDFHPVGSGGLIFAVAHPSRQIDRPSVQQEFFRQGGLPCIRVRNNGECSPSTNFLYQAHVTDCVSPYPNRSKRNIPQGNCLFFN